MSPEVRGTSNFSCGGGLLKFLGLVLYHLLSLISVFQIFRDLLYRRTKEHIFLTQRRKGRGALCPFVLLSKVNCTQNSQKYTEILLRMFCGCLRRLRETITRSAWVSVCSVDSV